MPKATLAFNLPEDQSDFELARSGSKLYCMLWDIQQKLREWRKYNTLEDRKWFYRRGKKKGRLKPQFKKIERACNDMFNRIDNELLEILAGMPGEIE